MYEITGKSLRYGEKRRKGNKNGDHFFYGELPEENLLIAIVADGVTGRPCDWLASTLSCQKFMEHFKKPSTIEMKQRIKDSIIYANEAIIKTDGECHNMTSTMVLMVWNYKENACYIFGIGDSRIYKCYGTELDQLTIDNVRIVKKVIIDDLGKRTIDSSGLTEAMGNTYSPKIHIEKVDFLPGELMLLASDGYIEARKSSFRMDMITMRKSEDLEIAFEEVFTKYMSTQQDDLTGVVVRSNKKV